MIIDKNPSLVYCKNVHKSFAHTEAENLNLFFSNFAYTTKNCKRHMKFKHTCTKLMLYLCRWAFYSSSELSASHDWQAMALNILHRLLSILHFVHSYETTPIMFQQYSGTILILTKLCAWSSQQCMELGKKFFLFKNPMHVGMGEKAWKQSRGQTQKKI